MGERPDLVEVPLTGRVGGPSLDGHAHERDVKVGVVIVDSAAGTSIDMSALALTVKRAVLTILNEPVTVLRAYTPSR